ncbi:hypothetical protein HD554DRAFT_1294498 [Boletus coccyginus]|nr:hypothetical protein HD554DRAFT_1294498 [Boletus coccyginus]
MGRGPELSMWLRHSLGWCPPRCPKIRNSDVAVAGSVAFKVLERHLEVFKDMFLVGQARAGIGLSRQGTSVCDQDTVNEEGNKVVDGSPTADIYDCPSDRSIIYWWHSTMDSTFLNPTPATSQRSPASSVYPRNISSSTCAPDVSHDSPTTGPPRSQTGTDERQQRQMRAHPAMRTPTLFSPPTSPSNSAYPKYSPARSTTSRATGRAGSSPVHVDYYPGSQLQIRVPLEDLGVA